MNDGQQTLLSGTEKLNNDLMAAKWGWNKVEIKVWTVILIEFHAFCYMGTDKCEAGLERETVS